VPSVSVGDLPEFSQIIFLSPARFVVVKLLSEVLMPALLAIVQIFLLDSLLASSFLPASHKELPMVPSDLS
jgi:hypothetical protein